MDLDTFRDLLAPTGRAALAAAAALDPTEAAYPRLFDRLAKRFPAPLARAALDTVLLRQKASAKFTRADEMFFTREALEQSSGEAAARYRGGRFAGFARVADLGCGIGGDAIGLALAGCRVTAVDRDPLRLAMAEANVAAYELPNRATFAVADVLTDPLPECDAVFADPGRRAEGKRFLSLADYAPPPAALLARLPPGFPAAFKLAPGLDRQELDAFDAEAEFVSVGGELKECVAWFGPLRTAARRATLLPGPYTVAGEPEPVPPAGPIGEYVLDVASAVVRAELEGNLAAEWDARPLEPGVALLTCDEPPASPFATAYRVEAAMPYHAARLRDHLRAANVGGLTVLKRGSSLDADDVTAKLKLKGDERRTLILTRADGKAFAVVAVRGSPL